MLLALAMLAWVVAAGPGPASAHTPPPADLAESGEDATRGTGTSQPSGPSARSTTGQVLTLADGSTVHIQLDSAYAGSPIVGRLTSALNALPHVPEMNKLGVVLVDLDGLLQICHGSSSCYFPGQNRMVVPVDPDSINMPMPFEMTVAHEYGHHIEANRNSNGWYATHYGARNWASYERVCEGARAGRMFPGNQGSRYWENPAEAFAQAYAFMVYPAEVPWWWTIAAPSEGAYAAIRADIADTPDASTRGWAARLNRGKRRTVTTLATPLDGEIEIRLKQPRGSRFKLLLLSADGKVLRRGRHYRALNRRGRATALLSYEICGTRSVRVEVRRIAGKGKFTAKIARL